MKDDSGIDSSSTTDGRRFRLSWRIAAVAVPYACLCLWLQVGGDWSSQGGWPHWKKGPVGYLPDQLWDGLLVVSLMCVPIPIGVLIGLVVSIYLGLRVVANRPVVLCWIVPELLTLLGFLWFLGKAMRA